MQNAKKHFGLIYNDGDVIPEAYRVIRSEYGISEKNHKE